MKMQLKKTNTIAVVAEALSIPIRIFFFRLVHDCREELFTNVSNYSFVLERCEWTYLLLIPRRRTRSQHIILDTTRRQVIQHRMIRHNQHAAIVLHWRRPVQNTLAQKHRQTWRRRQITRCSVGAREP